MRRKNSYDRPGVSPFASQYATAKESEAKLPVLMPRTKNANDNTPDEDIRSDCATLYKSELADEDAILKRRGALRVGARHFIGNFPSCGVSI